MIETHGLLARLVHECAESHDYYGAGVSISYRADIGAQQVRVRVGDMTDTFFIYEELLNCIATKGVTHLGPLIEDKIAPLIARLDAKYLAPEFDNTTG